jgi:hypothetical protein
MAATTTAKPLRPRSLTLPVSLSCSSVLAGDALVTSLREPARFFDALYRRFLRESAPNLHALCLRGMSRVFRKHYKVIGEFEDTEHIIFLLRQSTHQEVSDRLLELLEALAEVPHNAEKLINEECLQVRVRGCVFVCCPPPPFSRNGRPCSLWGEVSCVAPCGCVRSVSLCPCHCFVCSCWLILCAPRTRWTTNAVWRAPP